MKSSTSFITIILFKVFNFDGIALSIGFSIFMLVIIYFSLISRVEVFQNDYAKLKEAEIEIQKNCDECLRNFLREEL